jgi:hypothetical protein
MPLQPGYGGFLVSSLFETLSVVCRASDGSWAALKVAGLKALRALLLCFAGVTDPESGGGNRFGSGNVDDDDFEEKKQTKADDGDDEAEQQTLLLEQYQVQLSAVLKSAFAVDELAFDPHLRAAACQV